MPLDPATFEAEVALKLIPTERLSKYRAAQARDHRICRRVARDGAQHDLAMKSWGHGSTLITLQPGKEDLLRIRNKSLP
jgi:hypothetical protein